MSQIDAIGIITSFYENYNNHDFDSLRALFSQDVIYTINDYPPAIGIDSLIEHMHDSVNSYREQLIDIIPMANQEGNLASVKFRFLGQYFGDGKDLGLELKQQGQSYDLPGYNFFVITNSRIAEIKAFFSENDLKKQILADEKRLEEIFQDSL